MIRYQYTKVKYFTMRREIRLTLAWLLSRLGWAMVDKSNRIYGSLHK
jgi:hypothetical protein